MGTENENGYERSRESRWCALGSESSTKGGKKMGAGLASPFSKKGMAEGAESYLYFLLPWGEGRVGLGLGSARLPKGFVAPQKAAL